MLQVSKKKKEQAKAIREKAAPVVRWLRTAEEESSSEDEDLEVRVEELVVVAKEKVCGSCHVFEIFFPCVLFVYTQVEYSNTATGNSIVTADTTPAQQEGTDIDIDAI